MEVFLLAGSVHLKSTPHSLIDASASHTKLWGPPLLAHRLELEREVSSL
jgi:hypothetical protein